MRVFYIGSLCYLRLLARKVEPIVEEIGKSHEIDEVVEVERPLTKQRVQ